MTPEASSRVPATWNHWFSVARGALILACWPAAFSTWKYRLLPEIAQEIRVVRRFVVSAEKNLPKQARLGTCPFDVCLNRQAVGQLKRGVVGEENPLVGAIKLEGKIIGLPGLGNRTVFHIGTVNRAVVRRAVQVI